MKNGMRTVGTVPATKAGGHTCRPPWLRGVVTQDDVGLHRLKQLRLLSVYGFGGCSPYQPNDAEMTVWRSFAKGEGLAANAEEMKRILAMAMPRGYRRIVIEGMDCRDFFLNEHNRIVAETERHEVLKRLCLARIGEVINVRNREDIEQSEKLLVANTLLLHSPLEPFLKRVGLVSFDDGTKEHVFLDFLPEVRAGSEVIVHRSIACEIV